MVFGNSASVLLARGPLRSLLFVPSRRTSCSNCIDLRLNIGSVLGRLFVPIGLFARVKTPCNFRVRVFRRLVRRVT